MRRGILYAVVFVCGCASAFAMPLLLSLFGAYVELPTKSTLHRHFGAAARQFYPAINVATDLLVPALMAAAIALPIERWTRGCSGQAVAALFVGGFVAALLVPFPEVELLAFVAGIPWVWLFPAFAAGLLLAYRYWYASSKRAV